MYPGQAMPISNEITLSLSNNGTAIGSHITKFLNCSFPNAVHHYSDHCYFVYFSRNQSSNSSEPN
jgi:hypothetical protein